ncbi:MAG: hypothetical protein WCB05_20790 [Candidatus Sulfotelmatobacter sp.]
MPSLSSEFVRQVNAQLAKQHTVIARVSGSKEEYDLWDTITGTKTRLSAGEVKAMAKQWERSSIRSSDTTSSGKKRHQPDSQLRAGDTIDTIICEIKAKERHFDPKLLNEE